MCIAELYNISDCLQKRLKARFDTVRTQHYSQWAAFQTDQWTAKFTNLGYNTISVSFISGFQLETRMLGCFAFKARRIATYNARCCTAL